MSYLRAAQCLTGTQSFINGSSSVLPLNDCVVGSPVKVFEKQTGRVAFQKTFPLGVWTCTAVIHTHGVEVEFAVSQDENKQVQVASVVV